MVKFLIVLLIIGVIGLILSYGSRQLLRAADGVEEHAREVISLWNTHNEPSVLEVDLYD